jgi:hypothetical protein
MGRFTPFLPMSNMSSDLERLSGKRGRARGGCGSRLIDIPVHSVIIIISFSTQ